MRFTHSERRIVGGTHLLKVAGIAVLVVVFLAAGTSHLFSQLAGPEAVTAATEREEAAEDDDGPEAPDPPKVAAEESTFVEPLESRRPSELNEIHLDRTRRQTELFRRLAERVSMDYSEVPLLEAIRDLAERTHFEIVIDDENIKSAGIDLNVPVTLVLNDVRLDVGLELLLAQVHLAFFPNENILLITSPDDAASRTMTRIINVRHLLPKKSGSRFVDSLTNLLTSSVAADSWTQTGGCGTVNSYHGFLFVTNTYPVIRDAEFWVADLSHQFESSKGLIALDSDANRQLPWMCPCQNALRFGQPMHMGGMGMMGGGMFDVDSDEASRTDVKSTD